MLSVIRTRQPSDLAKLAAMNADISPERLHETAGIPERVKKIAPWTVAREDFPVVVETVIEATCAYFRIKREWLVGESKAKTLVIPRACAMCILYELKVAPVYIGEVMNRDRTEFYHLQKMVKRRAYQDRYFSEQLSELRGFIISLLQSRNVRV